MYKLTTWDRGAKLSHRYHFDESKGMTYWWVKCWNYSSPLQIWQILIFQHLNQTKSLSHTPHAFIFANICDMWFYLVLLWMGRYQMMKSRKHVLTNDSFSMTNKKSQFVQLYYIMPKHNNFQYKCDKNALVCR